MTAEKENPAVRFPLQPKREPRQPAVGIAEGRPLPPAVELELKIFRPRPGVRAVCHFIGREWTS